MRGAWIEFVDDNSNVAAYASLPVRGAWIEITADFAPILSTTSLPVRGAWIEIQIIRGIQILRIRRSL